MSQTHFSTRFLSKINKTETCWLWGAGLTSAGYGQFKLNRQTKLAHRLSYELHVGEIPKGLQLDHLCRVRHCVNPDHLEPVTLAENIRRGDGGKYWGAKQKAKTHCPKGHLYSEENTYVYKGRRNCRECHRQSNQRGRDAKKAL